MSFVISCADHYSVSSYQLTKSHHEKNMAVFTKTEWSEYLKHVQFSKDITKPLQSTTLQMQPYKAKGISQW